MKNLSTVSKKRMRKIFFFSIILLLIILLASAMRPMVNTKLQSSDSFAFKALAIAASSYDALLIISNSVRVTFDNNSFSGSDVPIIHIRVEEGSINKMASNLPTSAKEKYYKAELLYPDGVWRKIKYRFRGRGITHWDPIKPSLRLKLPKENPLNQLRHINLINPEDRAMISNYFGEYLGNKIGVMTHNTDFTRLFINEKFVGLYHLSTREDEEMIRVNNRIPGPLFSGNNLSQVWKSTEFKITGDQEILSEINLMELLVEAINLEELDEQHKQLWSILSMDKYARFNALLSLVGGIHTDYTHNHLYYFDPTLGKLEPVVSDINGHGLLLYPSPRSRLLKANKPFVEVPINGQNNPLVNIALLDPEFRHLRNQYLYQLLEGDGSYKSQVEELKKIFQYIDSSVISDRYKKSIIETFVGWFRVPYSNKQYEQSKDVLFDWIKNRNIFLEQELSDSSINIDFIEGKEFDRLLLKVNGNSSVIFDTSVINGEIFPVSPDGSAIVKTDLYTLHPGISLIDPQWRHGGAAVYDYEIAPGIQLYEFKYLKTSKSIKNNLLSAFSNAITNEKISPIINEVLSENSIFNDYKSEDSHLWNKKQVVTKNIILGPGPVNITKNILISPKQTLTVMPGTTLNLANKVSIISYGKVKMIGKKEQPIILQNMNSNSRWGVFAIIGKDSHGSKLQYTNISGGSEDYIDNINFSGMLSVHWSDNFEMSYSTIFDNLISDDTLHIVHSKFEISHSEFRNCFADCVDLDYADGIISNSNFDNAGNDGIDLMTSKVNLNDSFVSSANDKGISVGEMSEITINNSKIELSNIGIAVKDQSTAKINNSKISDNEFGLSIYKKNWRYGSPGTAIVKFSKVTNNTIDADVQKGGSLFYDINSIPNKVIGDGVSREIQY